MELIMNEGCYSVPWLQNYDRNGNPVMRPDNEYESFVNSNAIQEKHAKYWWHVMWEDSYSTDLLEVTY